MNVHVGTSGWSYPSWRPDFYPAGLPPAEFLGYYARFFDTVELNTTGYRLPPDDQFKRWAESVPDGFRFAPKLPLRGEGQLERFLGRVRLLGDRLGPLRVVVELRRDERLLERVLAAAGNDLELAFDFRHASWQGIEGVVVVGDARAEPFGYLRLRDPPYSDAELRSRAAAITPPSYVYFRHEQAASAPAYARRLQELLATASGAE